MECPRCGAQLNDQSAFCLKCGTPVGGPAAASPAKTAPAPQEAPPTFHESVPAQPPAAPAASAAADAAPMPAPTPPPAMQPAAPASPPAAARPSAPRPLPRRSLKVITGTDKALGALFALLGLAAMVAYGLWGYLFMQDASSVYDFLHTYNLYDLTVGGLAVNSFVLLAILAPASYLLGFLAGFFLLVGGLISLARGKGKNAAYASVVLMLFCLLFGGLMLWLIYRNAFMPGSGFASLLDMYHEIFSYHFITVYLPAALVAVLVSILLPIKKAAKRRHLAAQPAPGGHPQPTPAQNENMEGG